LNPWIFAPGYGFAAKAMRRLHGCYFAKALAKGGRWSYITLASLVASQQGPGEPSSSDDVSQT